MNSLTKIINEELERFTTLEKYNDFIRTPEFISWFGDWENSPSTSSKVVDENGMPLLLYHGSPEIFDNFDSGLVRRTDYENGKDVHHNIIFFTPNKNYASNYGGNLKMVFLNIRNPHKSFKCINSGSIRNLIQNQTGSHLPFDGFYGVDCYQKDSSWVTTNLNQIKNFQK